MRRLVEAGHTLSVRGTAQTAIEGVSPGMVAASQHRDLAAPRLDQTIAAMLADIMKCTNFAVAACHYNDALLENVMRYEATRLAQFVDMRDQVPRLEKYLGLLLFVNRGVVEETRRQGVPPLLILDAPACFIDGHTTSPSVLQAS